MRLSLCEGRLSIGAIVLIFLLVLIPPGMALTSKDIVIIPAKSLVIADGMDFTGISVLITNVSQPREVDLTLDDSRYGSIDTAHSGPDLNTSFSTIFRAKTVAGAVRIRAEVHEQGMPPAFNETILYLDNGVPTRIHRVTFEDTVDVATSTSIEVVMEDAYGNIVDGDGVAYGLHFTVGSVNGGARFENTLTSYDSVVNDDGVAAANLTVDAMAGSNWVRITPPAPIIPFTITITGHGSAPAGIVQIPDPVGSPYPEIPADGSSTVTMTYLLTDTYGNPSADRVIRIETSLPGEVYERTTLPDGSVLFSYGPKFSVGEVNIRAYALDNVSVECGQLVRFVSTAPVSMLLTANPQSVPSRDVDGTSHTAIMAKVIDVSGNPVPGETVYFEIGPATYPPSQEEPPSLSAGSAITDDDGFAVIQFSPGRFVTSGQNYDPQASANCSVFAHWSSASGSGDGSIRITWMNFPYIYVETVAQPETLPVSQGTNITIRLRGEGWALQAAPIDVMLCTDRSGSMLYDDPDRMYRVREASREFVNQLSVTRDRIGLSSFGRKGDISRPGVHSGIPVSEIDNAYVYPRSYSDYATLDRPLSTDFSGVRTSLDLMVPDHGTSLRAGVYLSINEIRNHARDGDTVRAIVLLSDGDYNWYGDPLARGHSSHDDPDSYDDLDSDYYRFSGLGSGKFSDQNMSVYARNNNIKIFSIGYADELSAGGRNTLAILARGTGGKYYNGSAGNIADVYRAIAGELKEDAGVNTTMDLHFQTIHVNDGTFPGEEVFEYQYVPGISTYEKSYNATLDPWPGTAKWYDQTDEWDTGKNLHFDVGTIHQGQTWEVTLRMRVLKEGNINVIGPGSFISFNNGESMVGLPDTYVTATANLTPSPSGEPTLVIERPPGLVNTNNATLVEFLYLNWWVTYDGEMTYTETLTYQYRDPATWVWGPEKSLDGLAPKGNGTWINGNTALYLPTLYPGEYIIHLRAIAQDGARDEISLPVTLGTNKPYIILK